MARWSEDQSQDIEISNDDLIDNVVRYILMLDGSTTIVDVAKMKKDLNIPSRAFKANVFEVVKEKLKQLGYQLHPIERQSSSMDNSSSQVSQPSTSKVPSKFALTNSVSFDGFQEFLDTPETNARLGLLAVVLCILNLSENLSVPEARLRALLLELDGRIDERTETLRGREVEISAFIEQGYIVRSNVNTSEVGERQTMISMGPRAQVVLADGNATKLLDACLQTDRLHHATSHQDDDDDVVGQQSSATFHSPTVQNTFSSPPVASSQASAAFQTQPSQTQRSQRSSTQKSSQPPRPVRRTRQREVVSEEEEDEEEEPVPPPRKRRTKK
eukprot:c8813_g1_i2.p1 GENE.c8813_g1_i2~~c8813_g1_i2.p1  ORF type:complete len:329 (-),score=70.40 c8813_g1_i2:54-1040(-)